MYIQVYIYKSDSLFRECDNRAEDLLGKRIGVTAGLFFFERGDAKSILLFRIDLLTLDVDRFTVPNKNSNN